MGRVHTVSQSLEAGAIPRLLLFWAYAHQLFWVYPHYKADSGHIRTMRRPIWAPTWYGYAQNGIIRLLTGAHMPRKQPVITGVSPESAGNDPNGLSRNCLSGVGPSDARAGMPGERQKLNPSILVRQASSMPRH